MPKDFSSPEAVRTFVDETRNRLRAIRPLRFLAEPARTAVNPEEIHRIFREIHSLKSASNLLGFTPIQDVCHALEDVLAGYRDAELVPGPESEGELEPTLALIERLTDNIRVIKALDVSPERRRLAQIVTSRRRR